MIHPYLPCLKKNLSRWRQSSYSSVYPCCFTPSMGLGIFSMAIISRGRSDLPRCNHSPHPTASCQSASTENRSLLFPRSSVVWPSLFSSSPSKSPFSSSYSWNPVSKTPKWGKESASNWYVKLYKHSLVVGKIKGQKNPQIPHGNVGRENAVSTKYRLIAQ